VHHAVVATKGVTLAVSVKVVATPCFLHSVVLIDRKKENTQGNAVEAVEVVEVVAEAEAAPSRHCSHLARAAMVILPEHCCAAFTTSRDFRNGWEERRRLGLQSLGPMPER